MSSTPLPAVPLLVMLLGVGLIGGAGYIWLQPASETVSIELPQIADTEPQMPVTTALYHSPNAASGSSDAIQNTSPFAPDRSTYSRTSPAPMRRVPPAPVYDPQFVGTSGKGEAIRALIIWKPGEQAKSTAIGDETPWGVLRSATSTQLQFEGEDGVQTLSMF